MRHARLSASGSGRWMNCAGSVLAQETFCEKYPEQCCSGIAAASGSVSHYIAEQCLREGFDAAGYIGGHFAVGESDESLDPVYETLDDVSDKPGEYVIEFDQDSAASVQTYVDYVRALALDGKLHIEQKLDMSLWVPGGFGTEDAIVHKRKTLHVIDFKDGFDTVDVCNSEPMMLYAIAAREHFLAKYDIDKVEIHIVQPRIDNVESVSLSSVELDSFEFDVENAAAEALSDNPQRTPGVKQCKHCDAAAVCAELEAYNVKTYAEGFEAVKGTEATVSDAERIAWTLERAPLYKVQTDACTELARYLMEDKLEKVPGFKLVRGRGSRSWADVTEAEKKLKNVKKLKVPDVIKRVLISPAQAEKLIGKEHPIMKEQISWKLGKITVAPDSDKRPAVNVGEGFENVNEDK